MIQKLPCSYCGYMQALEQLDTHPSNCLGRNEICQYCKINYPAGLMDDHLSECSTRISRLGEQEQRRGQEEQQDDPILRLLAQMNPGGSPLSFQAFIQLLHRSMEEDEEESGLALQQLYILKKYSCPKSQDQLCPICYCKIEQKEIITELKCNHTYHSQCIQKWLERSRKCPVCKTDQGS